MVQIQEPLPRPYHQMETDELRARIAERKERLGSSLCILGHHYQRDEVIEFADFAGDSLELSQLAAKQTEARFIVFCGVHFMAESADVLSGPEQVVCLPNLLAGCAMAAMADEAAVRSAIEELGRLTDARVVPVAYVNSTAAIKAATARAGGACCTSSNVLNVFRWALSADGAGGEKILAVPDQHLGRNTAVAMGLSTADCAVYDPDLPDGGLDAEAVARAKVILWRGHCYVHQRFTPEQVRAVRAADPKVRVIVHPECPREVVELADASGSTAQIIRAIEDGRPGDHWAIGTESNLVNRLANRHREQSIRVLSDAPALCAQMHRIDLPHLLWVLDHLADGRVVNQVSVPPDVAADARTALQRMIDIKAVKDVTPAKE